MVRRIPHGDNHKLPPRSRPIRSIQREIVTIVPGAWEIVWHDAEENAIFTTAAQFTAGVREFEVIRGLSGDVLSRQHIGDYVAPIDPNDTACLDIMSRPEYCGMIPVGADYRDPRYGILLPKGEGVSQS